MRKKYNPKKTELIEDDYVAPIVSGIVFDCDQLNVRVRPDINSEIICRINVGSEVMINESESVGRFYKICTATGVEGFCLRNFIEV